MCVSYLCVDDASKKYECSDRFCIYKYIGDQSYGVEHAISSHRKIPTKDNVSLCVNLYCDGKGPNIKEIQKIVFNIFHCSPSYWKCWKGGLTAMEMCQGTAEHEYSCLPTFSYMFDTLNVGSIYSITVRKDTHILMFYFLAFGACIRGFSHMRKVIAVEGTHLHGKYEYC